MSDTIINSSEFAKILVKWGENIDRNMPWKGQKSPYKVWLSEIILQQTRVEQGRKYYLTFIHNFPTVADLATASVDTVLGLWKGLGYYSRARNLHETANDIINNYNGKFPTTYKDLLKLKGVGHYTAAAIASFCYDEQVAVLDGNVYRVLARIENNDTIINTSAGKKVFSELASKYLGDTRPSIYNQAIMDFGALICTPNPKCDECPVTHLCNAFNEGVQKELPKKKKNKSRKKRYFNYLINKEKNYLRKREGNEIWEGLYEPYLIESDKELTIEDLTLESAKIKADVLSTDPIRHKQVLSHQEIYATFWIVEFEDFESLGLHSFSESELSTIGLPKIVDWFLSNNSLYLFE